MLIAYEALKITDRFRRSIRDTTAYEDLREKIRRLGWGPED